MVQMIHVGVGVDWFCVLVCHVNCITILYDVTVQSMSFLPGWRG